MMCIPIDARPATKQNNNTAIFKGKFNNFNLSWYIVMIHHSNIQGKKRKKMKLVKFIVVLKNIK